ncbi:DMT family transporter [Solitalea koreensis]|uniref:EamA-like transporter family protein n=1 Tax=Solitalea koreensis TaxID=543615 RepID=A0A521D8W2_9SPHI|nr:EamA family transporter [Solitalea koreensis]SMO68118.1 EamA-like transporter family protein [Solitalea koreensis]
MHLNNNLLKLHFTVVIWGFTAILGALISVSALSLVWYRILIASLTLLIYLKYRNIGFKAPKIDLLQFFGIGILVATHWIFFFHAIKISTVSVTLVCLSSQTLFTGILEPLFTRTRISKLDILIGVLIVFGITLIFHFESQYTLGIIMGLTASLLACLFNIFNSKLVKRENPVVISFYELTGGLLGLTIYLAFLGHFNTLSNLYLHSMDVVYLLILGIVCTALAYVVGVAVMKELSAYTVALVTNMEPVYGIVLALLIFKKKEQMTPGFYVGAFIVMTAVFLYPFIKRRSAAYKARKIKIQS